MQYKLASLGLASLLASQAVAAPVAQVAYTTVVNVVTDIVTAGVPAATSAPAAAAAAVKPAVAAAPAVASSAVAASKAAVPAMGSSSSTKCGIAYNSSSQSVQAMESFVSGQASWAYDWVGNAVGSLAPGIEFVPMMHSIGFVSPSEWASQAGSAAHVLGYNEPDLQGVSPSAVCSDFMSNYKPGAGKALVGSPSITSSMTPGQGYQWLQQFQQVCPQAKFDFISVHWYGQSGQESDFQNWLTNNIHANWPNTPVWVTEFALVDAAYNPLQGAEQQSFLQTQSAWMDSQSWIARYSPFMAGTWPGFVSAPSGGNSKYTVSL